MPRWRAAIWLHSSGRSYLTIVQQNERRRGDGVGLDLLIRGGRVVDGTGDPARIADVGIAGDRIVAVDEHIDEPAAERVDADGLVVAPGFIDSHTHMDGQLFWDEIGSSSAWHGCTTVVCGNCGFTLAPIPRGDPEYPLSLMAGVEQIPRDVLQASVPFDWDSFAGFVASLERRGLPLNMACYVGHPVVRHAAMGERSLTEPASEADLDAIEHILREALDAGALGVSFNRSPADRDDRGRATAGVDCGWDEVRRMIGVLADYPGTLTQAIPGWSLPGPTGIASGWEEELDQWVAATRGARRPMVWGPLIETYDEDYLRIARRGRRQGARMHAATGVVALSTLATFQITNLFATIPGWEFLFELSEADRLKALAEPQVRVRLRRATGRERFVGYPLKTEDERGHPVPGPEIPFFWHNIHRVGFGTDAFDLDGPSLAEEAERERRHPVDVMLDGAVASRLREFVIVFPYGQVPDRTLRTMQDEAAVLSRNDTGAHLSLLCNAESTQLLAQWVRDREAISLERAIHLLTARQAEVFQLSDRGALRPGLAADVVLLDLERVGPQSPDLARDVPGGGTRIVQRAEGIERVIVSGRTLLREGRPSGERPGRFLRPREMAGRS